MFCTKKLTPIEHSAGLDVKWRAVGLTALGCLVGWLCCSAITCTQRKEQVPSQTLAEVIDLLNRFGSGLQQFAITHGRLPNDSTELVTYLKETPMPEQIMRSWLAERPGGGAKGFPAPKGIGDRWLSWFPTLHSEPNRSGLSADMDEVAIAYFSSGEIVLCSYKDLLLFPDAGVGSGSGTFGFPSEFTGQPGVRRLTTAERESLLERLLDSIAR